MQLTKIFNFILMATNRTPFSLLNASILKETQLKRIQNTIFHIKLIKLEPKKKKEKKKGRFDYLGK